jgi:gliding motility-associated-like protein
MKRIFLVTLVLAIYSCPLFAQTYTPIALTGYNNDIIAETGTDAEAVTSTGVDLQQKILYSLSFATTNILTGGIPDNGTIVSGSRTYQLEDYALNNALFLSANGFALNSVASGDLTLATPASYSKLSLLAFSTEQTSKLNITLHYADGSTLSVPPVTIADWFGGPNAVISAIGRIIRQPAAPYIVEDLPALNPRLYAFEIAIPCTDQSKTLASITFDYVSGGGNDSRAVILSLSGVPFIPITFTSAATSAACGKANGTATVNASGGAVPLSYEWSSSPAQITATATDLPTGTYFCTITDGNICPTLVQVDVPQASTVRVKALAKPGTVCEGNPTTLYAVPSGGKVIKYTWQPGNITDSSARISPVDTTMYVVTGEDIFGCIAKDSIKINVNAKPAPPVVNPLSVCPDSTITLSVVNADPLLVYNWYPYASGGDLAGTGATYTTPPTTETTTWFVEAVSGPCSGDRSPVTVTSFGQAATPVVTTQDVTASSAVFTWKPVPGATGYLISVDGGPYVTPDSSTYYKVSGLNQESVSIRVIALGVLSCQNSEIGAATAKLKPGLVFIPNAFTPNGDGKNDIFKPEGSIRELSMKIFNQWGEMISETTVVGSGWNGISGGKAQPMGVYTYAIRIVLNNGSVIVRKGAVNLLR